ncbi:MAG: DMT family transporter [candidate division KSB1 bacterium]|nr:DMT family transporter [candidate division KSB1 bacterium]MDZ7273891.1 DMT family transporter [candidate division KSB1 bacterium]MDZ7286047.1 DMT family transporter [candidate division KSB1 bacterium]MDZ7299079.1 DMT family transporter [candidate division KSB1 bacterium]MDZ7306382.1 DMT family transporter [candidate division KSB1 bacterium]
MSWLILALGSAVMSAVGDTLCKKAAQSADSWTVTWVRFGYASIFLLPLLPFIDLPRWDAVFALTVAVLIPLELTAASLSMRALQLSPLSLTVPYLAFTPLFLLVVPTVLLGEKISARGAAGVVCIVLGAYWLNLQNNAAASQGHDRGSRRKSLLSPLQALAREKGSRLMLLVAALYSVTSTLGKVAVQHSSPFFFAVFYYPLASLVMLPLTAAHARRGWRFAGGQVGLFLLIGLAVAATVVCHYLALSRVEVAYMISVKRTSMIFATLLGWWFFHEENILQRLWGCSVMLAGVILIVSA